MGSYSVGSCLRRQRCYKKVIISLVYFLNNSYQMLSEAESFPFSSSWHVRNRRRAYSVSPQLTAVPLPRNCSVMESAGRASRDKRVSRDRKPPSTPARNNA